MKMLLSALALLVTLAGWARLATAPEPVPALPASPEPAAPPRTTTSPGMSYRVPPLPTLVALVDRPPVRPAPVAPAQAPAAAPPPLSGLREVSAPPPPPPQSISSSGQGSGPVAVTRSSG
jgi:hypothetical protein